MPTPTMVTITGDVAPDLRATGIYFRVPSNVAPSYNAGPDVILPGTSYYSAIATDGTFSLPVPGTNDPAWSPANWTYKVQVVGDNLNWEFDAQVPYNAGTMNFSALLPAQPASSGTLYAAFNHSHGGGGGGAVDSVFGRSGIVVAQSGDYTKSQVGLANVDNTSDANKPVSSATQTALNLKAPLASPTFTGTVGGITSTMVGLGNVNNTSDANKPVSTATQTALDLKAPLASPTFTGTVAGISKTMVGLGNVDDTSDANKPVSTAQQTALDGKVDESTLTTKGDLYVASASATPVRLGVGSNGQVLTADSTTGTGTKWATPSGGGGATTTVKRAIVTSGNITPQNTSGAWQALTGGPTLTIAAAVGDYISIEVMSVLFTKDNATFWDLAVLNGASLVRFGSNGTGTPATEGDGSFYPDTNFPRVGTIFDFVAVSGDINGGNVTACWGVKSGGVGALHAGFYPLRWRIVNYGAITVT